MSPGAHEGVSTVEARGPTFSWGLSDQPEGYVLVVYQLAEEGSLELAEPVLREGLPGSARSWTPPLDRCLIPGGRCAWLVRTVSGEEAGEWSVPRLFEVALGSSQEELEEALAVVRTYLEEGESSAGEEARPSGDSAAAISTPAPVASGAGEEPIPLSHEGSGNAIIVDGAEVETKADPPCYPSTGSAQRDDRYINCFNGTVLDTVTGLLWLRNANCLFRGLPFPDSGERNWWDANAFAAGLASNQCGLTDHSQPGDWRLPTLAEWETTVAHAVTLGCTALGAGNPPSLTNNPGTNCLEVGPTYFFDAQSLSAWSSTTLADSTGTVWGAFLVNGCVDPFTKDNGSLLVWPVRVGQ